MLSAYCARAAGLSYVLVLLVVIMFCIDYRKLLYIPGTVRSKILIRSLPEQRVHCEKRAHCDSIELNAFDRGISSCTVRVLVCCISFGVC